MIQHHPQRWFMMFLAVVAMGLYVQTMRFGFVLDDEVVIVQNKFVHKGFRGIGQILSHDSLAGYARTGADNEVVPGGRYRPLSLVCFALLMVIFGQNPIVFHAFGILAYAVLAIVLFRWLKRLLADRPDNTALTLTTCLLFVVHPVHTEVVANCKSVDETLALLFGLLALLSLLKHCTARHLGWSFFAGFLFFVACLAKENAITFVLIAPVMLWFFMKTSFSKSMVISIPIFIAGFLFLLIRFMVLKGSTAQMMTDPLNQPFLTWSGHGWVPYTLIERLSAILYIFFQYVRLMVFPHPLTHDYYPFMISAMHFDQPGVWAGLGITGGMLFFIISGIRQKRVGIFGLIFFALTITLVLNIFFQIGTFMAERFLFLPSLGGCLAISAAWQHFIYRRSPAVANVLFGCVVLVFSGLTLLRNSAWKDNLTLFRSDARVSANSAKLQSDLGSALLTQALQEKDTSLQKEGFENAFMHLGKALKLHPGYYDAMLAYGAAGLYSHHFAEGLKAYQTAYSVYPEDPNARLGLFYAYREYGQDQLARGNIPNAVSAWEQALALRSDDDLNVKLDGLRRQWNVKDSTDVLKK